MTRELPVHGPGGVIAATALVDDADYDLVAWRRWRLHSAGYAIASAGKRNEVLLHREILGLKKGDPRRTDHRNRNPLDNRRSNLRIATHAQNMQNLTPRTGCTSRHRGVSWNTAQRRWIAKIRNDYLGSFEGEDEAAAVAKAAREIVLPFSEV